MDEKPYQCLGEAREPLPMCPGDTQKMDSEYIRKGDLQHIYLYRTITRLELRPCPENADST